MSKKLIIAGVAGIVGLLVLATAGYFLYTKVLVSYGKDFFASSSDVKKLSDKSTNEFFPTKLDKYKVATLSEELKYNAIEISGASSNSSTDYKVNKIAMAAYSENGKPDKGLFVAVIEYESKDDAKKVEKDFKESISKNLKNAKELKLNTSSNMQAFGVYSNDKVEKSTSSDATSMGSDANKALYISIPENKQLLMVAGNIDITEKEFVSVAQSYFKSILNEKTSYIKNDQILDMAKFFEEMQKGFTDGLKESFDGMKDEMQDSFSDFEQSIKDEFNGSTNDQSVQTEEN